MAELTYADQHLRYDCLRPPSLFLFFNEKAVWVSLFNTASHHNDLNVGFDNSKINRQSKRTITVTITHNTYKSPSTRKKQETLPLA